MKKHLILKLSLVIGVSLFHIITFASVSYAQSNGNLLWSYEASDKMLCVSSIGDVNGNGVPDVLAGSANDTLYCFEGGSEDTATIIWTFASTDMVVDVDSIPDVSGNGVPDVIIGGFRSDARCIEGENGELIWKFYAKFTYSPYTFVEPMGDVNGDGVCDVVIGPRDVYKIYCIDGASIGTATVLWDFPLEGGGYLRSKQSLASIGDVNGDSIREIVVGVGRYDSLQLSMVYCISGKTGSLIWEYDAPEPIIHCVNSIDDINGNNTPDVLAGSQLGSPKIYCLEGEGGQVLWEYLAGGNIVTVVSIDDVNGDKKPDVIASGGNYTIFCIEGDSDSTGNLLWSFPAYHVVNYLDEIADVNGDSIPDVVAGTWNGYVYCIEGNSGNLIWSYSGEDTSIYGDVMGLTAIKDVNGDGTDDVAAVTYSRKVWCIEGDSQTGVEETKNANYKVQNAKLYPCYPNPFHSFTVIRYSLSKPSRTTLKVHDVSGRVVKTLVNDLQKPGYYRMRWDLKDDRERNVASGVYFYRIESGDFIATKKMVLIR